MARLRALVLLLAALALICPQMVSAQVVVPPCRFHGTVQLNGYPVANGTPIVATIGRDTYTATTFTRVGSGSSQYDMTINPPQGVFYNDGTSVLFAIGNYTAQPSGFWKHGGNIELHLSAFTPPTLTPAPTPTPLPEGPAATPLQGQTPAPTATLATTPAPTAIPVVTPVPSPTPLPTLALTPNPPTPKPPTPRPPTPRPTATPSGTSDPWITAVIALAICFVVIVFLLGVYLVMRNRVRRW